MGQIKRVTLTKKDAESPWGQRLIHQILAVSHDGELTIDEVRIVHARLREGPPTSNAIAFLRALTTNILADGVLDAIETYELRRAMERVVPKTVRMQLTELLSGIGLPTTEIEDDEDQRDAPSRSRRLAGDWRSDPVTQRQLSFIRELGGNANERMTKGAASELIDDLLERRPPTPRQLMLLRFFDRVDMAKRTKEEVSVWIDEFYATDERYERAWDQFKVDVGDDRTIRDPQSVPIGEYRKYMRRGVAADSRRSAVQRSGPRLVHVILVLFLLLVGVAVMMLVMANRE